MIVDSLNHSTLYESVHKDFAKVFECVRTLSTNATGKIVLDEGNVWVSVCPVAEVPSGKRVFEAHRDFIDIHYILSGAEKFGYSNIDCLETTKAYNSDGDCELLEGEVDVITLKEGDFCVVFPEDAHIPDLEKVGDKNLVRVVAKIRCK